MTPMSLRLCPWATTMFSSSIQPGLVSLFSSTGSDPPGLFSTHTDDTLPSDSLICLLNDATSQPTPPTPRTLITATGLEDDAAPSPNYTLDQTVLHIQSPTLRTTYMRCPPVSSGVPGRASASTGHLGLKHPWIHLQVRNMGREWSFEMGLIDQSGREGIVRCSTFQVCVYPSSARCSRDKCMLSCFNINFHLLSFPCERWKGLSCGVSALVQVEIWLAFLFHRRTPTDTPCRNNPS